MMAAMVKITLASAAVAGVLGLGATVLEAADPPKSGYPSVIMELTNRPVESPNRSSPFTPIRSAMLRKRFVIGLEPWFT